MIPVCNMLLLWCSILVSIPIEKNCNLFTQPSKLKEEKMISSLSIEANKKTIRRLYEECLNKKNMSLLKELVADEYPGFNGIKGAEGFAANLQSLLHAFPDITWTIDAIIEEGDLVVVRATWKGTHTAAFRNFSPTQKHITNDAITIYKISNNKIVQSWVQTDRLGFLQQLGVVPEDLTQLQKK